MTVSWKLWISLFYISLALFSGVMLQEFSLEPTNSAVLQGSTARFNATVQGEWTVMTWRVRDRLVLTILSGNNASISDQFTFRYCTNGNKSCVEFTMHNVTRELAGPVSCELQGILMKTAQLEVQESGTISIAGGNRTADQGDQVEFQCEAASWFPAPTFSWTQNGHMLDSSLFTTNSTPHGDSFNSSSVLKLRADSSTTLQCLATVSALTAPVSSSVFLEVHPDWTVLIAVVVSFGSFALLVLLIIGIIFCYRRRKEKKPSYNDEMMRARTQSVSGVKAPGQKQGKDNEAYVVDGRTSVTHSEFSNSDFYPEIDFSNLEMPDIVSSSSHVENFKKHRHVTIV